jgi:Mrp family chromosome partitioning ATPase
LRGYCESILYSLQRSAGDDQAAPRLIGITSCYTGEGVTTLATELARAAAAGGQRVLLADVNFESPGVHQVLNDDLCPGLAESFRGGDSPEQLLRELPETTLSYLTAGAASHTPQAGLKQRLRQLAEFASEKFDLAVFDLPPLDRPADTFPICGLLDGVLLLVESERVRWPVAKRHVAGLTRSGAKPLGVVMNKQKRHVPQWLYKTL